MRLHHVINCLVGPRGRGFDAAVGNPCKGVGKERWRTPGGGRSAQALRALAVARRGVAAKELPTVHKAASEIVGILGQ